MVERKKPRGSAPNPMCTGRSKIRDADGNIMRDEDGNILDRPCENHAITGGTVCWTHGGRAPQVRAKAAVRAELMNWGLGDSTVEPGEVLLRLVSQSAARAELYSGLLSDAFDAAERLQAALDAEQLLIEGEPGPRDDKLPEAPGLQAARADLERIFTTGGVSALIGNTYADTKDGRIYATGEAIRGLAKLEADERDRCANFSAKAIAAGLAERQVRLAERQAELVLGAIEAALDVAGIPAGARGPAKMAAARHLKVV
ncbi:hypothetical protein ACFWIW_10745 [Amycolatopsis sp. NPDC058340]|uniref:hypothetical protein n=1 Tax=Amycolatopsis sp. NPDC058340 TaxID=3346453 RepID=UPI00365BBC09